MQEKITKALLLGTILFLISVELAEVINFIYITPFYTPFLLFLASTESELHQDHLGFSIPFIFGLLSDILTMNGIFALCIVFLVASYFIYYLVDKLKIPKTYIFLFINLAFALVQYTLGFPIWASLIVAGSGFLAWEIFSWTCSRFLAKENG